MSTPVRTSVGGSGRGAWLVALLVVSTLLPASFVLWFMNEAITTQATAARQQVVEAYRGQLRLVRSRIDGYWRERASALDGSGPAEARFLKFIGDGTAEGVIVFDANGLIDYPDNSRSGSTEAALEARLAAAERAGPSSKEAIDRIGDRLNDYAVPLAAAERLHFMDRLRKLSPGVSLPTQAALRLSLDLLDAERPVPAPDSLRETSLRDVWALTSADRRAIALFTTGRLEAMMQDYLRQVQPAGIVFTATPPDVPASAEAIAASAWMPGWQITYQPTGANSSPLDDDLRKRRTRYIAIALGGIAVMTIVGIVGGGMVRRHLELARVKTDLVAAASHELRTPLASIRVLVDGLLADATHDPVKTREYLELIAAENARLSRLIENFLTFARLERDRYRFTFEPVAPSQIVSDAVTAIRDRMPPSCDLLIEVEPDLPQVLADPDALSTALVNLLDNAIKYTPGDKKIRVRARRDGDTFVSFVVQDNGIGIPIREQRRIFRRFYRVDQRLSRDTAGVGLGLSIVALIVKAHGGAVTVRSEPGAGSTFAVRLPRAAERATA
jgi:two-component system, OmpR family, phosphate regulon sensor histidine kinase PhoR